MTLSGLAIGSLTLVQEDGVTEGFNPELLDYTAATTDATNKITAAASDEEAEVVIKANGKVVANGSAATWLPGKNIVEITVAIGEESQIYTAIVDKTNGILGSLTVASEAGIESGYTAITVTETLTEGHTYRYKTDTTLEEPVLDEDLALWGVWDGESEIAATTGHEIVIAEVYTIGDVAFTKKAGKTTVSSLE